MKAYWTLRQAAAHQTSAGAFARKFLKSIVEPEQIEISDLTFLDQDNANVAITLEYPITHHLG